MVAVRMVLGIVYLIVCVALVVLVLLQESKSEGISAVTGGSDTFFGKGKTNTKEGMLNKLTVVFAIAFGVIAIVLGFIMKAHF